MFPSSLEPLLLIIQMEKRIILVFHESLYYGNAIKHSLINPNQIRCTNGLDFADNPIMRDERGLQIEMDYGLFIPLECRVTKLQFTSRVPTREELDSCPHFEMTHVNEWNPEMVDLRNIRRIMTTNTSLKPIQSCQVFKVNRTTDPCSDESVLNDINPCLVFLKELSVKTHPHHNKVYPARHTFINKDRHKRLTAESLSELWHIGPKRAHATLNATTQYGIRSASIMPLSRRYHSDRMYNIKRLHGHFATDIFFADMKSIHGNTLPNLFT